MTVNLDFLPLTAFVFLLIFARVGAMVMMMPGIGDHNVPANIRLVFALALTLVLFSMLQQRFPPLPATLWSMLVMLGREVLIGIALGLLIRMIVAGIQIAGSLVGFQTGLSFATSFDPNFGGSGNVVGTFLSMLAMVMIFAIDLHHLLLRGIFDSYELFTPATPLPLGDFGELAVNMLAGAFRVATQISAPFIVFGLIFYLGIGVIARLIPQIQVFFIAMPAAIFFGLILLMILLSVMMMAYFNYFTDAFEPFLVAR